MEFGDILFVGFIILVIICAGGSKGGKKGKKPFKGIQDSTVFRDMR